MKRALVVQMSAREKAELLYAEEQERRLALEQEAARLAGGAVRHGLMGPGAPLGGAMPTYRIYATADGHVALGAVEPHFAARVHELIGTSVDELTAALRATEAAVVVATHDQQMLADLGDWPRLDLGDYRGGAIGSPST